MGDVCVAVIAEVFLPLGLELETGLAVGAVVQSNLAAFEGTPIQVLAAAYMLDLVMGSVCYIFQRRCPDGARLCLGSIILPMSLLTEYNRNRPGWGLAWYLAAELAQRFYISHSIAPTTIFHDGLGFYGIALDQLPCRQQRERLRLGRLTIHGDVENWSTGGPGDHGLKLAERAEAGEPVEPMIAEAIAHLGLPAIPKPSHLCCRHQRWGASAVLVFRLAAALALRHKGRIDICNEPELLRRETATLDPNADQAEHLGWTRLEAEGNSVALANDGRILVPVSEESLWVRYMRGEAEDGLLRWLEKQLGLDAQANEPTWRREMRACRMCNEECPEAIYSGSEGEARPLFHEEGNLNSDLLFVVEAPNYDDTFDSDKDRLTYDADTDPTGVFVRRMLHDVLELEPQDVLITNSVLCLPATTGGKYPVQAAMRKNCSVHLRRMIEEMAPKIVVTLGGAALYAVNLVAKHSLKLKDDVAQAVDWCGRLLFPLYHPSMLGRVTRPEEKQVEDWRALGEVFKKSRQISLLSDVLSGLQSGSEVATILTEG